MLPWTGERLMAQDAEAEEGALLEEILVTATKRVESIYDVPIAITAFTEEMMVRQGITELTDIGKFVPNLNVTGFSAGHTSSVNPFIRGIGLQDHLITTDPGVVGGVFQVLPALRWIIINNLTRRPELEPAPQAQQVQRKVICHDSQNWPCFITQLKVYAVDVLVGLAGDPPLAQYDLTATVML